MKKILLSTLLTLLTLTAASAALAQTKMPGMNHNSAPIPRSSTSMSPDMGLGDLAKLSGKAFDRAFLSMMIPHHRAAIDMARAVLPRSKDATVQKWARAIISAQQSEVAQMNTLLGGYGGLDTKMAAMMDPMKNMGAKVKASKTPDQTFIHDMVGHHASAMEMSNLALQKSSNSSVLKLARGIVTAQATEMYDFQIWLLKR